MESSENCTYFQSTGGEIGQCRVRICPCREHICQLRLDFGSFIINGPSTSKIKGIHSYNDFKLFALITAFRENSGIFYYLQ